MRKIDFRHAAFHVLVAVYFLWLIVCGTLVFMSLSNLYNSMNMVLNEILALWLILNLFMGTVLFVVLRLFKNRTMLYRVIFYSFIFMLGAGITAVFMMKAKA